MKLDSQIDIPRIYFLMLYIYSSVFTYSSIAVHNQSFSLGLNIVKSLLLIILSFLGTKHLNKYKLLLFIVAVFISLLTLDDYFISLVFLSIVVFFTKDLLSNGFVLKILNRVSIIGIITVLVLYTLGFLENIIFYDELGFGLSLRESLGFYNPNPASLLIFSSIVVSLYTRDVLSLTFSSILFVFLMPYFGSRTYLYSIVIFFLVHIFANVSFFKKAIDYIVITFLIILPVFIKLYVVTGNWYFLGIDINALTSDRLNRIRIIATENDGLSLLPSIGLDIVDSGLTNILFKLGLIIYFLFVYYNYKTLFIMKKGVLYSLYVSSFFIMFMENIVTGYVLLPLMLVSIVINKSYESK